MDDYGNAIAVRGTGSKTPKYKFFFKSKLGNWSISPFTVYDITFNCGEQYMMYAKARKFNDTETAKRILEETSPKEQKKLGRLVKNFDGNEWDRTKFNIVKNGLRQKFLQNPEHKEELLKYEGYQFVEASPYDRIWGIGFNESDALNHIDEWGENLLGKVLTELATEIKQMKTITFSKYDILKVNNNFDMKYWKDDEQIIIELNHLTKKYEVDDDIVKVDWCYHKRKGDESSSSFGFAVLVNDMVTSLITFYEPHGFEFIPEKNMVVCYGHENVVLYWIDTKEFKEIYTR